MNDHPTQHHENPEEKPKSVRLLEYLKEVVALRSMPIRDVGEYEKILWVSDIPHEPDCSTRAWPDPDNKYEPDEWIQVKNRREPELPTVPALCKEWVTDDSLRNKNDLPELIGEITRSIPNPNWREDSDQPETIERLERLADHPEIQAAWDAYVVDEWLPWMEQHTAWEEVDAVYSILFAIHQTQLRLGEEYELVLGLGLLNWQTPAGQRVRRHLVVADAILEFEARLGKFTVAPLTEGAKLRLELDMLNPDEQPTRDEEKTATSYLEQAEDDPWQKDCIESALRALVHSVDAQGTYHGSLEKSTTARDSAKPIVNYAPALVLRKRSTKGLTETLAEIKQQVENGGDIPGEFAGLAEIGSQNRREPPDDLEEATPALPDEIFFPKASNDEQLRIVDKIQSSSGVLVQGPPGTGKSHTIANLICHLLATGQRTLITAKTPRALQVLEGLVPEGLRHLCINLLGSGPKERTMLESSVGGILSKHNEWDEERAKRECARLESQLRERREEKTKVTRRLREIRESETHSHFIAEGTYSGTAARIAEAVERDRDAYGWFVDSPPLNTACPISASDMLNVLDALRQFTPEMREELGLAWPKAEALPSAECFAELVRNEISANEEKRDSASGANEGVTACLATVNSSTIEAIRDAVTDFRNSRKKLMQGRHTWMNDAICDVLGANSLLWREILQVTRGTIASSEGLVAIADETTIEFPNTHNIKAMYDDACELKAHVANGDGLGWGLWRPKPVKDRLYIIKSVKINGRPCTTGEHFSQLANALKVRLEYDKAWKVWEGREEKAGGPYRIQLAALKSLHDALENTLALEELIAKYRQAIRSCPGMEEPAWAEESEVEKIACSCRLALASIRKQDAADKIQHVEIPITRIVDEDGAHPATNELLSAIRDRDINRFSHCAATIHALEKQRDDFRKMDEHLANMRDLPQLASSLQQTCNEPHWENRIECISDAWHWAQARYWVEDYIKQDDVPAQVMRVKQIEDDINRIIEQLASLHAWSFCFSRLKKEHLKHMVAWQQAMRRLGRGTGRHAPTHRRDAQTHLNKCREAVPAWVMPLHRVWDTVSPAPGMFDVIIVDEASQCGLEALPLFYLGKKILIVGDDKQISPDAVGRSRDPVKHLMDKFLYDFEYKSTFDIESSLFDYGARRYVNQRITLCEHFRCMPEIIRFSNELCYSDTRLIPLRQYGKNRLPPLRHVFVEGGYREGQRNQVINRPEADAIVERIKTMCRDSQYQGKTMGVVVLQGSAQAPLIEEKLRHRLGAEEMEKRRLICGNSASFQGEERDIMLLSLVAASNERIGSMTTAKDERRFNVAASRARDQMILFHSVTCNDLGPTCLRRKIIEFFENPEPPQIAGIEREELERRASRDNRSSVNPLQPFDSWFEVDVALELLRRNFTVIPQHEVAGRRIDLVIEGGQARLAVECDGDYWHGSDQYEADMGRQRTLERCGWEFFRVRESAFRSNKGAALARLWGMLEERDISPNSQPTEQVREVDLEAQDTGVSGSDFAEESGPDSEDRTTHHPGDGFSPTKRRAEDVDSSEIQDAIIKSLKKCPNQTCTLSSLTKRVLKEIGIRTRGIPRDKFDKRTMQSACILEENGRIEFYKATNQRIRLTKLAQGNAFDQ